MLTEDKQTMNTDVNVWCSYFFSSLSFAASMCRMQRFWKVFSSIESSRLWNSSTSMNLRDLKFTQKRCSEAWESLKKQQTTDFLHENLLRAAANWIEIWHLFCTIASANTAASFKLVGNYSLVCFHAKNPALMALTTRQKREWGKEVTNSPSYEAKNSQT